MVKFFKNPLQIQKVDDIVNCGTYQVCSNNEYQSVVRNIRKEEVVLARLRLGHTRVTHSYLLQGESSHNALVATHHSLYVTSFWNVATLHKLEIIASMLIT